MTNTLSLPRSGKLAILASALAYTGLSFGIATTAAPVEAAGAPYYTAKLTVPASDLRAVADGVAFGIPVVTDGGHIRKLEEVEADMIRLALARYQGQMSEVARKLGIGRSTLYRRMKDLGLDEAASG